MQFCSVARGGPGRGPSWSAISNGATAISTPSASGGLLSALASAIWLLIDGCRRLGVTCRATRTALVLPVLFALGKYAVGNETVALFAAFGSFAMLLLVDFGGSARDRVEAHLALSVAGAALICLGTLASRNTIAAATVMLVLTFGVLFSGVVSSVLAGSSSATTRFVQVSAILAAPPRSGLLRVSTPSCSPRGAKMILLRI